MNTLHLHRAASVDETAVLDREAPAEIGQLVVRGVARATPGQSVGEVRGQLGRRGLELASEVVLVDGSRIRGVIGIEPLLAADAAQSIERVVRTDVVVVDLDTDPELVAARAAERGARIVAVTDERGHFVGLVPAERLLGILSREHEEDLARIGGSLSSAAIQASEEPVSRRLWHRLPWLVIGLIGAMASAAIVASFEEVLRAEVLLAVFVPAVVYMADAVGTQTETVVIRGMSLGVPLNRVVKRELFTGLVIGVVVAATFFAFAMLVWDDTRVAAVVALALFVSTSLATAVAMLLPYALARFGWDPAFGSGPLATVIQDLLSILAYFSIAVLLLP